MKLCHPVVKWLSNINHIDSECGCNPDGSTSSECDSTGKCTCNVGFDGEKCGTCSPEYSGGKCESCSDGYFGYPDCKGMTHI